MTTLKQPEYIFFNGDVVRWELAQVHVWSETAIRATNVFEGLRAYWIDDSKEWRVVGVVEHLDRLMESARLLRIGKSIILSHIV